MNGNEPNVGGSPAWFQWGPRILIAVAILLLLYFTQSTYRFKGRFDDTFLAEENLKLIRGPLAKKEYYERGEVDYKSKPLFEVEVAEPVTEILSEPSIVQKATEELEAATEETGNVTPEQDGS